MILPLVLLGLQILQIDTAKVQMRVVSGHFAKDNEFPFLVGISIRNAINSFWCDGNIISPEWVMTAAHCFDGWKPWQLGAKGIIYYGSTEREQGLRITFKNNDLTKHPKYHSLINDLALIRTRRVDFSERIRAISLPSSSDRGKSNENVWALVAGWNRRDRPRPDHLMWTTVKIASPSECPMKYRIEGELSLCGRVKPGSSICDGDSGGPLVHPEKRTLIGMISFIRAGGTCDRGELVGFANVVNYLPWIWSVTDLDSDDDYNYNS